MADSTECCKKQRQIIIYFPLMLFKTCICCDKRRILFLGLRIIACIVLITSTVMLITPFARKNTVTAIFHPPALPFTHTSSFLWLYEKRVNHVSDYFNTSKTFSTTYPSHRQTINNTRLQCLPRNTSEPWCTITSHWVQRCQQIINSFTLYITGSVRYWCLLSLFVVHKVWEVPDDKNITNWNTC